MAYRAAVPVILGARRRDDGYLEIYVVQLNDRVLHPDYAGLYPYLPGRYQVNVKLPEGVGRSEIRLRVGETISGGFPI